MLKAFTAVANAISTAVGGLLRVTGPSAGATRTMTVPDANFTVARTDSGQTFTGNQNVAGFVRTTTAVASGYGTGAGGAVTQDTDKTTTVVLNKPCGQITTSNALLAANSSVNFQVTNSLISSSDVVVVSTLDDFGKFYLAEAISIWDGYFNIRLTNLTGSGLSQAVRINFAIIKGATS